MRGERDTAPRLDASVILASCLQLGPCCTRDREPQQIGRAFLSPPFLVAAGDLEIWSCPWGRACICAAFCSASSLAQTNKRYSRYVSPSWCPAGTQQIPAWLEPAPCRPLHPLKEATCLMQDRTKHSPSQGRAGLLQSRLWLHLPSTPSSWLPSRKEQPLCCCSHDPPWRLMGFLKGSRSMGRIFPCALISRGPVAASPAWCPSLLSHSAGLSHHLPPGSNW